MKYKINWFEVKQTSTGKQKADVALEGVEGNITIWGDYPNFSTLAPGSEVEGDLVPAKDPKYGPTLYPPKVKSTAFATRPPWANKTAQIKEAMETKTENIKDFQATKDEAIKMSSSATDATAIVTAFYASTGLSDQEIKLKWEEWRKYFYDKRNEPFVG